MSSKLVPANPSDVMVIRNITPRVVTLSVPFARVGLIKIGGRGTLLKLTAGGVVVFSPVALTPEVKAKVEELGGGVRYIIAPDMEHHIFVSEWAAAWPDARIIGPEGLAEKRAKQKDERVGKEPFFKALTATEKKAGELSVAPDFDADIDIEYMDGHPNREIILLYKPDGILVEADLVFNLPATEQYSRVPESERAQPLVARWFTSLQTPTGDAKAMKRFLWYAISAQNRSSFNASCQRIASWDFKTLIPCHGDTVEGTGKEFFEKIFEWHLQARK